MKQLQKLYYSLREEIRYNQEQDNKICMFCYTTCVAILAFAYSQKVEMVALLAQISFIPFAYRVGRVRDSIAYLSAYMYVELEPKLNISWEKDHKHYRQKHDYSSSLLVVISRMDLLLLSLISCMSYWIIYGNKLSERDCFYLKDMGVHFTDCNCFTANLCDILLVVIAQIVCLGFIIAYTILYSNIDKMKKQKIKKWKKLINSCEKNTDTSIQNESKEPKDSETV